MTKNTMRKAAFVFTKDETGPEQGPEKFVDFEGIHR